MDQSPVKDKRFLVRNVLWFVAGFISWYGILLWLPFIVIAVCFLTLLLTTSPRTRWYVVSTLLGLGVNFFYVAVIYDRYITK